MYKIIHIILFLFISQWTYAQLSPGDLAKAHAHLEGISNCTKCHVLGEKVENSKCLDCHNLLNDRIRKNLGYHASSDIKGKQCIECHSDHHGRKFELIRFDKNTFKHELTGYKLKGKHQNLDCKACHQSKFIADKRAAEKDYTFLGLNPKCASCHTDVHQQTLSTNCNDCHTEESFVPASKFNHQNTKYPLLGKHQNVDCINCHRVDTKNGQRFQQFAGVKFNSCTSCHTDVHKNKFGPNCTDCHSVNSFRTVKALNNFDHNIADFKLTGKHKNVDCKSCHKGSYTAPIEHNRCSNCHQDYHQGQFVKKRLSPDCKDCHTLNGFVGSTYSIDQHNKSIFPLRGSHLATPCFACHQQEEKWQFRNIGETCVDCHNNIHKEVLKEKYYPKENCEACHSENRWSEIQFDHNKTKYKLLGAHEKQTCRSCHFNQGEATQKFTGFDQECLSCHQDEHQKQFEKAGKTDCLKCHQHENWTIAQFNHDKTDFKLEGKHATLDCAACHKPQQLSKITFTQYKFKDFTCATCHQ
ncbi:hypothetical protein L3049_08345 [Labilibaculum sp. DW002]|uniref:Cytochrome C n=1 Tax=Paralabilibaculum antarcticum TaxID=2912572 RepID=A0ABT5VRF9_9BACT|nr:hypothetical protein [Labilibaculum sp. DW002]MDE5418016.1 hypothetical protein [Labilibaculum sp. DW002]